VFTFRGAVWCNRVISSFVHPCVESVWKGSLTELWNSNICCEVRWASTFTTTRAWPTSYCDPEAEISCVLCTMEKVYVDSVRQYLSTHAQILRELQLTRPTACLQPHSHVLSLKPCEATSHVLSDRKSPREKKVCFWIKKQSNNVENFVHAWSHFF